MSKSPESVITTVNRAVNRTVVLVHGLWYGTVSLRLLGRRLRSRGFDVAYFSYPTVRRPVRHSARALHSFATDLTRTQHSADLDFVGHSLGGLVILRMLHEYRDLPPGRVVVLGSPVAGSSVARRMVNWPVARGLIGRSGTILKSGFSNAPTGRETAVIAGTRGMGLGRAIERLDRPHDGTVSVAETRLSGATAHLQMPVSHTGLVLSQQVAQQTGYFLTHGQFMQTGL